MTLEQALQENTAAVLKLASLMQGASVTTTAGASTGAASSTIGKVVAKQGPGPNGETRFFFGKKNENLFKMEKDDTPSSLPEVIEISKEDFLAHQKRLAEKFKTLSKKTAQAAPAASPESAEEPESADESSSETDDSGTDFDPFADDAADDSTDVEPMGEDTLKVAMTAFAKLPADKAKKKESGRDRLLALIAPEKTPLAFIKTLKDDNARGAFHAKMQAEA